MVEAPAYGPHLGSTVDLHVSIGGGGWRREGGREEAAGGLVKVNRPGSRCSAELLFHFPPTHCHSHSAVAVVLIFAV